MKFTPSDCPECHGDATGIDEAVLVTAQLMRDGDGTYDYAGESDVAWDSQEATEDAAGRVTLTDAAGHDWLAEVTADVD